MGIVSDTVDLPIYPSRPILTLPYEIKNMIVKECDQESLTHLAAVHTTLTCVAEEELYHTLTLDSRYMATMNCLTVLSSTPKKAGYVRFLRVNHAISNHHVLSTPGKWASPSEVLLLLATALEKLHGLHDLRLCCNIRGYSRYLYNEEWKAFDVLGEVVMGNHFKLRTLYCPAEFVKPGIFLNQQSLEAIGASYLDDDGYNCLINSVNETRPDLLNYVNETRLHISESRPFVVTYSKRSGRITFISNPRPIPVPNLIDRFSREWIDHPSRRGESDIPWRHADVPPKCSIELFDYADTPYLLQVVDHVWTHYPYMKELEFQFYGEACTQTPIKVLIESLFRFSKLEYVDVVFTWNIVQTPVAIGGLEILHPMSGIWTMSGWKIKCIAVDGILYTKDGVHRTAVSETDS